jgi:hypothetical protein
MASDSVITAGMENLPRIRKGTVLLALTTKIPGLKNPVLESFIAII